MAGAFCRVATYNIHGGLDSRGSRSLEQIGATLRLVQSGLTGLQEVERAFRARAGFADQPALLARQLSQDYRFAAALHSDSREGAFGLAVLSTWPILSSWSLPLPGAGEPRVLLGTLVDTPCGHVSFLVCHLGLDQNERQFQVGAMLRKMRTATGPVILVGDFNAAPNAPELSPLFGEWQEAQTACHLNQATFPPGNARLDYIFCSQEWRILRACVIPSPASDHRLVVADLTL